MLQLITKFLVCVGIFLSITVTSIAKQPKIVGLVPARNEAPIITQCLKVLSLYTDAIVYLDDASEDNSLDLVKSIADECRIERIITKTVWHRDEPGDRNLLLQAGREIGGTHFIVLDADEMISANCLENNYLRSIILTLRPGEKLVIKWTQLWRDPYKYRDDDSVWKKSFGDFIFCDDGQCSYNSDFIHTPRSPQVHGAIHSLDPKYTILHFQFVNWHNLYIKQAWYRCLEHIRDPNKPVKDINAKYAYSMNEDGLKVSQAPQQWFYDINLFNPAKFDHQEQWRKRQIVQWFDKYTKDFFAELDIWDIDWNFDKHYTPSLLIKIPTRTRPTAFFAMLEKYYHHLSGEVPYHFLISCDCDDTTMNNQEVIDRLQSYPHLTVRFGHNTTKIEAYNDGVADFMPEYDVLLVTSDDMEPIVHGYDKIILQTMLNYFPDFDGVLNYHDGHIGGQCNTYPIIGKKYFNRFGYIYHPDYASLFCDEEFTIVSDILKKSIIIDQPLLIHHHPGFGNQKWDALYRKNEGLKPRDRSIFIQRLVRNFDLPSDVTLQKKLITSIEILPQDSTKLCIDGFTDHAAILNIFVNNRMVTTTRTDKSNHWQCLIPKPNGKQNQVQVTARYTKGSSLVCTNTEQYICYDVAEI